MVEPNNFDYISSELEGMADDPGTSSSFQATASGMVALQLAGIHDALIRLTNVMLQILDKMPEP